jgi:hypothetical protein
MAQMGLASAADEAAQASLDVALPDHSPGPMEADG